MVIDILYDKFHQYSGDEKLRELVYYMLTVCCKPYLHMLYKWLYNGNINDPYAEFMIVKDSSIDNNALNEKYPFFWQLITITRKLTCTCSQKSTKGQIEFILGLFGPTQNFDTDCCRPFWFIRKNILALILHLTACNVLGVQIYDQTREYGKMFRIIFEKNPAYGQILECRQCDTIFIHNVHSNNKNSNLCISR